MPIEEKPQLLEFDCKLDSMPSVVWNIKYDPIGGHNLQVIGNGQDFIVPVELFGDVTAFLQSKNIIKPNILARGRTVSTPTPTFGPLAQSLLPPKIDGTNNMDIAPVVRGGAPMDALASFDITNDASTITQPSVTQPVAIDEIDEIIESIEPVTEATVIKVGDKAVDPKAEREIPKRVVIRTRVSGDDPQSAEKQAAILRGEGKEVKKNFKRTE